MPIIPCHLDSFDSVLALLKQWIETHMQLELPLYPLFYLHAKIEALSGNPAALSQIEEGYQRCLKGEDDIMFADFLRGLQRMQEKCYSEAIAFFERVIGFSP